MNGVNKHIFEQKIRWRQESGRRCEIRPHSGKKNLTSNPGAESSLFFEKDIVEIHQDSKGGKLLSRHPSSSIYEMATAWISDRHQWKLVTKGYYLPFQQTLIDSFFIFNYFLEE